MTLKLGPDPDELLVNLVAGGSWWTTLVSVDDADQETPYDDGVMIILTFASQTGATLLTRAADVQGADASIRLTVEEVESLIENGVAEATVWWQSAADRIPWAKGPVYVE